MIVDVNLAIISYLVGCINFAYWIGRKFGMDISKFGDENLGATNLYYALKDRGYKHAKLFFISSALLDILKSFIITYLFGPLYGFFTILGHCFSIISYVFAKKLPTGLGFASSLGWALAVDFRILLIGLPFSLVYFVFEKYFEWERGHTYYSFLIAMVGWIYTYFINPEFIVTISFMSIAMVTAIARFAKLLIVLENASSR